VIDPCFELDSEYIQDLAELLTDIASRGKQLGTLTLKNSGLQTAIDSKQNESNRCPYEPLTGD
jgi:hypothetical protein